MDNKEKLDALVEKMKDRGVVDMKFAWDYAKLAESSLDSVVEEVIALLQAIVDGKYKAAPPMNDSVRLETLPNCS